MSVVPAATGASERQAALAANLAPRDVRYNSVLLGADFALFLAGLAFASQSTILPAFAEHLGAPNLVIGAIPAVMTLGWYLPSLFAAGHTESLARKLPFVLRLTLWERVPFLVIALVAFFLAGPAPGLSLGVLLLMLLLTTGVGGILMPAWMDIVGRAIPVTMRGRFFGLSNVIGSAGGLLGSIGTAYFLTQVAAPASFGVCFLAAVICMALSYVALALVREPLATGAPPPREPIGAYLRRMPALVRRDHNLRSFLIARALGSIGAMANVFYTVYALRTWGAPDWWVATFTTVLLAGQMTGNLIFGFLSDRAGHRLVLIAGAVAGVAGNLLALGAPSIGVFAAVFALSGIQIASISVSSMNVLLEFAPTADERPTYVGLGSTLLAPFVFSAPLAAGILADVAGFPWVFAAAGVGGALSAGVLVARVRDPRQHPGAKRDAEP